MVQDKMNRSMGMLQSVGVEKDRWGLTSDNFKLQRTTLIRDVFLSSAFQSYDRYFGQQHRNSLPPTWANNLEAATTAVRADLAKTKFFPDPDERLNWRT